MELIEFKNGEGAILRGLYTPARSDTAVVFLHGFERTTIEYKFKNIADALRGKKHLFRFDFSGCGMSDGSFENASAAAYADEIDRAIRTLVKKDPTIAKIVLVAHSFASCAALAYLSVYRHRVARVVFFGPALNQYILQRYWFAQSLPENRGKEVTTKNMHEHMSEERFAAFVRTARHDGKAHRIPKRYFIENKDRDYQELFETCGVDPKNILIVHGTKDPAVPIETNDRLPKESRVIPVDGGDHDLHKNTAVKQYLRTVVRFIGE